MRTFVLRTMTRTVAFTICALALCWAINARADVRAQGHVAPGPGTNPLNTQDVSNQHVRKVIGEQQGCFRVVSAGVNTRNSSAPFAGGVITLPAGPTVTNIVWAGLYWDILDCAPHPVAVTLNGIGVAGATSALPVTASPCWSECSAFAYFADVTAMVKPGANVIGGLDDSGINNVGPESEGASLVVIYQSATDAACQIVVMDGNDLQNVIGQEIDNPVPIACPPAPGTVTFIGGDGQPFPDDQLWNFVALPPGGNEWNNSDPHTPGATDGWDTDTYGVPVVPPFTASSVLPAGGGDCVNWLATVVETGVQPMACAPTPTHRPTWGKLKSVYR